ncbi:signal peptidase II [Candidatus Woesearchaeota archaeon]|nr:signal peptidase II [Candidatus Woesearchaeota archaeon]|tara:strand:- start:11687 stop:12103 length:417 start_codon:yes stop_codon:yes gene_type:complete
MVILNKFFLTAGAVIITDQIIKLAVTSLKIPYLQNTGIAFGLLKGNNLLLSAVSAIVAISIIVYHKKLETDLEKIAVSLILGGTLSNLIDRLLRGAVLDYIQVPFIPTFNIADAALTAGAALIITGYLIQKFNSARYK